MVKTLVCLVVSMTGTSMLLSALDPSDSLENEGYSEVVISDLARRAVLERVEVVPELWREVHVFVSDVTPTAGLLTAVQNDSSWHFLVAPDGRPSPDGKWRRQQGLKNAPNTVRIQLQTAREFGGPTAAQWVCVRALVSALNHAIVPDGPPLAVVMSKPS